MKMAKVIQWSIVTLLFLVGIETRPSRLRRTVCYPPSASEYRRIERSYRGNEYRSRIHDSFGMIEPIRTLTTIPEEYIDKKYLRIEGDSTCPDLISSNAPLCPSYFVMEYDQFRIPDTMVQAECRCSNCQEQTSESGYIRECKKINYYTRVFRVVGCSENNVYRYEEVWEPISVGCHCVRSTSIRQNQDTYTGSDGRVANP
ncbi:interleukin 17-like protein [Mizuhopecten yessoensis]|uniref:Interleukin 17-like protein n=1 Tax=Mizuhopecten yessoensis TaxID=6573 RepID=A0A210Q6C6_MIZYE|nr:interleukin 17-like protein [Mizuhopecten yessoensis]OWF44293.1 hypothetical protein KP79_PYT15826 [Mizuhopecten yessoensis]